MAKMIIIKAKKYRALNKKVTNLSFDNLYLRRRVQDLTSFWSTWDAYVTQRQNKELDQLLVQQREIGKLALQAERDKVAHLDAENAQLQAELVELKRNQFPLDGGTAFPGGSNG